MAISLWLQSRVRRLLRLLAASMALLGCLAGGPWAEGADGPVAKEYELKAAFIYNFTKFVEWPSNTFSSATAPLVLGVVGKGPCAVELEKIVKDRRINGRDLIVKTVDSPAASGGVHILFVPVTEDSRLEEWRGALETPGTLSIGESEPFARQGGVITFFIETDKVRFDINLEAAEKVGVKVSAQLLKLARNVRRKS
jgi:hypothetical protein